MDTGLHTPIEYIPPPAEAIVNGRRRPNGGCLYLKRDDLYLAPGGAPGGKARTCEVIIRAAAGEGKIGIVTAGSRSSPQVNIVAQICKEMNLRCRIHTPQGEPGPEVTAAVAAGAERVEHFPGYNTVIVRRAEDDAAARDWGLVPFGMDTPEAVHQTAAEAALLGGDYERIVVPVGSGMTLCGILSALAAASEETPVLGVSVGADPTPRLDKYLPMWRWLPNLELVHSSVSYETSVEAVVGGVPLDPIYEAKCVEFLRPNDLLWVVGIRQTLFED